MQEGQPNRRNLALLLSLEVEHALGKLLHRSGLYLAVPSYRSWMEDKGTSKPGKAAICSKASNDDRTGCKHNAVVPLEEQSECCWNGACLSSQPPYPRHEVRAVPVLTGFLLGMPTGGRSSFMVGSPAGADNSLGWHMILSLGLSGAIRVAQLSASWMKCSISRRNDMFVWINSARLKKRRLPGQHILATVES